MERIKISWESVAKQRRIIENKLRVLTSQKRRRAVDIEVAYNNLLEVERLIDDKLA